MTLNLEYLINFCHFPASLCYTSVFDKIFVFLNYLNFLIQSVFFEHHFLQRSVIKKGLFLVSICMIIGAGPSDKNIVDDTLKITLPTFI